MPGNPAWAHVLLGPHVLVYVAQPSLGDETNTGGDVGDGVGGFSLYVGGVGVTGGGVVGPAGFGVLRSGMGVSPHSVVISLTILISAQFQN